MSLIKLAKTEPSPGQPIEQLLANRRCVREYEDRPVTLVNMTRLLRAAQGITDPQGLRSVPSAGALYPLEIYLAAGAISGLAPGIYRYLSAEDALESVTEGDHRATLAAAALGQSWLADAALTFIIAACYERTTFKYGRRGIQYVHMEAGHAAQNILLMAVALDLGAAVVGAFDDERVASAMGLADGDIPLYLVPVGHPA